jgi:hypothetical protein
MASIGCVTLRDVASTGGADQSGSVSSTAPAQLSVTLGPIH